MSNTNDRIETLVGDRLRDRDETVAVAESATGGLLSSTITDVPGASTYFDRGYVTYAYRAKLTALGVTRESLDEYGAVSEPVARQMARSIRDRAETTWGVSVTGIAGPSGGSDEKPVGTMFIGVSYAAPWETKRSDAWVSRYEFDGDRLDIKEAAARRALVELLKRIDALA